MSAPKLIHSISGIRELARQAKKNGPLGLVPTMGALHEGHLSLVRAARNACDTVVASIFVNPTQFGPNEDFEQYPRTLDSDMKMLSDERVDAVFAPSVGEMYPTGGAGTFVEVPAISERLDGAFRPGHFRGVATVVTKLFHIVSPDLAFFGQKDAAQVAVLRAMVRDLSFPVELVVCPTVRELDGLAMSSRNRYLSPSERAQSLVIPRALEAGKAAIPFAQCACDVRKVILRELEREPAARVEYAEVVDPDTLLPVTNVSQGALLAVAAWIGKTRLIDNLVVPRAMVSSCE